MLSSTGSPLIFFEFSGPFVAYDARRILSFGFSHSFLLISVSGGVFLWQVVFDEHSSHLPEHRQQGHGIFAGQSQQQASHSSGSNSGLIQHFEQTREPQYSHRKGMANGGTKHATVLLESSDNGAMYNLVS
jgi:hypothetical protein